MREKIALVTGGSRGIGAALCEELLKAEYFVHSLSRNKPFRLDQSENSNESWHCFDLSKPFNLNFELEKLDLLILNAGIGIFKNHDNFSTCEIERQIYLNFTSNVLLLNSFSKKLTSTAKIIFIGSSSAFKPTRFNSIYGATKVALNHFAKASFEELRKKGVSVSIINPDFVVTEFYKDNFFAPGKNIGESIEIESLVKRIMFDIKECSGLTETTVHPQYVGLVKKPIN